MNSVHGEFQYYNGANDRTVSEKKMTEISQGKKTKSATLAAAISVLVACSHRNCSVYHFVEEQLCDVAMY